ncbi:MAG: YcaO-like family protein, partial [Thermodesulfobacteriota bacterium]|nr:YcaO-like family protein [Thermodesulfobacteriota bacterium]
MPARIELKDCFKTYTLDQDKAFSPEETVTRVKKRLAQAELDILKKTERIDGGRLGIPVYISECGLDALKIMPTKKQMGKGATPAQAEASAIMEIIERYSFFHFRRNNSFIKASYAEVQDQALPFEHLAASVHHDPNDLDRARQALDGLVLSWTPALNLTQGQEFLVPFDWFYEINEFNGPAAGNTLEEAVMQGLAEVVERHVSALVCRGRLKQPSIDTASLQSPVARELVEKFERRGIKTFIKDFSLGMGIPTVGVLAYDPATFPNLSEIVFTAGTATDPEKALIRALTEVAQLAGDFNSKANFVASGLPKYTDLAQAGYVIAPGPFVSVSGLPDIRDDNIKIEIEKTAKALAGQSFEVYVINTTHPRINVPAVYTIVPTPLMRTNAAKGKDIDPGWMPISWDQALAEISKR